MKAVAKEMGYKVKFKETQWDSMFAGLDSGRFNVIANQVGINDERKEKYKFSEPYTYSEAVLVVNKNNKDIKSFDDVKGKKLAQTFTSNYGKLAKSKGAELTKVDGFNQAMDLLQSNRVEGTFNDNISYLDYKKQKPNADVKIIEGNAEKSQSALTFSKKEDDATIEKVNKAMKKLKDNGSAKMFLNLNTEQQHALDAAGQAFAPMLEGLVKFSIPITLVTFVLGLVIALLTALMRISTSRILRGIARFYISIIRGTPMIVQLFIIFYGIPELGRLLTNNSENQWTLAPVIAAIIGLSLNVGAYASEIIRGGIMSIPKGQTEAAYSIGMNYRQTIQRIILPQAIRVSVPALGNTFLSLIKDTSLLGFILVAEMFRKAQEVASTTYEYLTIYLLVALMYWVVCFIISIAQNFYESYLERGYRS